MNVGHLFVYLKIFFFDIFILEEPGISNGFRSMPSARPTRKKNATIQGTYNILHTVKSFLFQNKS